MMTLAPRLSPSSRPRSSAVTRAVVEGMLAHGHTNRVSATTLQAMSAVLGTWSPAEGLLGSPLLPRGVPGALYRSRDGAEHWELVNTSQPMPWIWGIQVEPGNPDVLYVSCFDVPPPGFAAMGTRNPWPRTEGGGLFKSTDAGKTWALALDVPQIWDVSFDPRDVKVVYACSMGRGVYRSRDAGANWEHLDGPPFVHTHKVTFDPADPDTIYVTTYDYAVRGLTLSIYYFNSW